MKDYKDTLKLPQTDFPMKAELAKREPEMLARWERENVYQEIQAVRANAPKFILHDGPPYANGNIHVGHASNKILKDIIVKAKVLSGFQAPYTPGWDCHGLPIEHQVEKKYGKVGIKQSTAEFRARCRSYAESQVAMQRVDFQRLGVLADWAHPYITMAPRYEANTIRTLAAIYQHQHIKRGYKPIYWCLDCASSLAEAEVEYQDKTSDAITVKFKVLSPEARADTALDTYILIWTTTPWTLPWNQAVAAGADIDYVLLKSEDAYYWVAAALHEAIFKDLDYQVLKSVKGSMLEGTKLQHPFYEREVPVVLGAHVSVDTGTGFVHIAPAHGLEDYEVCEKYGIEILNSVGANGCFTAAIPLFSGTHVSKANPLVIETLIQEHTLFKHAKIEHSYPHCWRHKTPLIFRATPQWFISMEHLLTPAEKAAANINFIPPEGKVRFLSMLDQRPDWCISRQRYWGVPIPFFMHKTTGALHPDTAQLMEEVAKRVESQGLEAWFSASPEDYGVASSEYEMLHDILDVWFDSGASSQCVLKNPQDFPALHYPADLYLEGSDQHRGWFQTSLLTALAADGSLPFNKILTHGFVVDGQGRKMSKSLGNVITPQEVINQYGADILRLWVAMSDYRGEMTISADILKQTSDLYRKLRNTFRFLLASLYDFNPTEHEAKFATLLKIDQWMVLKALDLQKFAQAVFGDAVYDDDHAQQPDLFSIRGLTAKLFEFCEKDLSNIYFDILKDRLYTENSVNRRSAQTALFHILQVLVRIITPILSFTADEVWQMLRAKNLSSANHSYSDSVFTLTWYEEIPGAKRQNLDSKEPIWWKHLETLRSYINKVIDQKRKSGEIGSNLDVSIEILDVLDLGLKDYEHELKYYFICSEISVIRGDQDLPEGFCTEYAPYYFKVEKSPYKKCSRCWHHTPDVSQRDPEYGEQELCERCYANVYGIGKPRKFF